MKKFLYIVIFIVCYQSGFSAKKLDSLNFTQHKEFFLHWDNDMFVFKDYYYTQGAYFYYIHPALRKNPANYFLLRLKNADNYFGLGLIQEIFTPKDVADSLNNVVDRPYAGTLFVRSFTVSSNTSKKVRLTSQFDLGILGPLAGARQAQQYIHEWLNLGYPNGWDFQIENRPYLNYNILAEKGLITAPEIFDFIATSQLRVGNIHDDLQAGMFFRIGRLNDYFKGYNLANKKYSENRDLQFYIFAGANASAVLYNATLMGGIIPPKNQRHFAFNEIENFVAEYYGGVHLSYKYFGLRGQVTWKTKEFELGEQHGWGTISMYLRF